MKTRQLTLALPANQPAVLTLPQPMQPETLGELERSLAVALGELRREMSGSAGEAARIEYASWLVQLGALPA